MSKSLSLTEQLAKHLKRKVDDATRDWARFHLLDWLACVAGARNAPIADVFRKSDSSTASHLAACLGNVLEMNDIHRMAALHPGPVAWGTLAVGHDCSMDEMLSATVRGYEAIIAVGSTFDEQHYSHFHNTATAGLFGASAAVAGLYDGNQKHVVSAKGLAGSLAGGLWQMRHEGGDTKQWHIERAMVTGGSAALYTVDGMQGPRFILEGPQGLYAATCNGTGTMA